MMRRIIVAIVFMGLMLSKGALAADYELVLPIYNNSFEQGMDDWAKYEGGATSVTADKTHAKSGESSVKVENSGEGDMSL